ncbi:MAG: peroxiredoxin-like family protein [Pseudomonadota bacterium]
MTARPYSLNLVALMLGVLMTVAYAGQHVPDRAEDVEPLAVGAAAPDFDARTPAGERFRFDTSGLERPALLIFYRGGWCPYCNAQLQGLRHVVPALTDAGYDVLFLSADKPELLVTSLEEPLPDYTLLSDASMEAARRFGVAFRLDDETAGKYRGYGIDLAEASGFDHQQLPVPAVFLVGRDGRIEFAHTDPDYTVRLEPDAVLAAAGVPVPQTTSR